MTAPDPIAAIITYLKAQSAITTLLSTRVYGTELHESAAAAMPQKAIVLTAAGTGFVSSGGGPYRLVPVSIQRVDIRCYGESPYAAGLVERTLRPILKRITRRLVGECLLHVVNPEGAPIAGREVDTNWPFVHTSWTVQASEIAVATP